MKQEKTLPCPIPQCIHREFESDGCHVRYHAHVEWDDDGFGNYEFDSWDKLVDWFHNSMTYKGAVVCSFAITTELVSDD